MVTKQKATKAGKTDKTVGPVTTSDMNTTEPSGTDDSGAKIAKAGKDKVDVTESIPSPNATALREARDAADADKNDLRDEARKAEEKAGAVPDPTLVPQGPSALRDWQVSNNPDPRARDMVVEQARLKQELRKDHHR